MEDLSRELNKKASEIEQLKLRLKQYHDYDEIKRELEIMKYVEFAGLDDELEDSDLPNGENILLTLPNPNAGKTNTQQVNSLETLLATKNKRILEELTKFRILHSELEGSLQTAREELKTRSLELEKQKILSEKLENDLLSMNKHKVNGDNVQSLGLEALDLGKKPVDAATRAIPFTSSADTSILPIVTSQRDRFRHRNGELEDELRKQFQIISELRSEIKILQSDNLKLYEKVRYMQSYKEEAGSRAPTSQLDPLPVPGRADDMSKYHARYEEAMNPFEAFRGREATRAYDRLNPVERGVLVLTRSILGNRRARTFFIIYALTLHILVMYTTYECAGTSGTQLQTPPSPF
ncbi:CASP C terminal-domain-containing protein [Collybia nuda]|uniref:CASP C terminal-domain-containing protein n=1 Tax=Collybia nuda TaxID=64659 RepID=A0A9P5YJK4_9AGAR|nr:CASP C terminal-domain-containing protein [Collybia nuda]